MSSKLDLILATKILDLKRLKAYKTENISPSLEEKIRKPNKLANCYCQSVYKLNF